MMDEDNDDDERREDKILGMRNEIWEIEDQILEWEIRDERGMIDER